MTSNEEAENAAAAALASIELTHTVVSLLDDIKTGLEERGWAPSPASHAATTLGNTLFMAGAMSATAKREP